MVTRFWVLAAAHYTLVNLNMVSHKDTIIMSFSQNLVIVAICIVEIRILWSIACKGSLINFSKSKKSSKRTFQSQLHLYTYHLIIGNSQTVVCFCNNTNCATVANTKYHYLSCQICLNSLSCSRNTLFGMGTS